MGVEERKNTKSIDQRSLFFFSYLGQTKISIAQKGGQRLDSIVFYYRSLHLAAAGGTTKADRHQY